MLKQIREARKNESGFTLIELLIVIVILGVLAGIVVFAVAAFNDEGKNAACKADVKNIEIAAEAYYAKHNHTYPAGADSATRIGVLVTEKYLKEAPAAGSGYTITLANDGTVTGTC